MIVSDRGRLRDRTRAQRLRTQRARVESPVEPAGREPRAPVRRKPVRRRYDLALPVESGAEVRLPALPVIRPGIRLVSAVLLAGTGLLIQSILGAPRFMIGEAGVRGAQMLSAGQIRSIANVDGQSVFGVDPREVVERLLSTPEVAEVELVIRWPNQVEITVHERRPMVEWDDAGETWWVSPDGVAFLKHGDWPGLVRIASEVPMLAIGEDPLAAVVSPRVLESAAVLASQLPEASAFRIDPDRGLSFEDPGGWTVRFGAAGDMVSKVRVYRSLVGYLAGRGIQPALISVQDLQAPYYSLQRTEP